MYITFTNLEELIEWLKNNVHVYYQAPLDMEPVRLHIRQYTVNNDDITRSRATLEPPTRKADVFVANLNQHFVRFRKEA